MATRQLALINQIKKMCTGNDVVYQPPKYAQDIMTEEVRTLTLDDTVGACIRLMKTLGFRHIPLMDIPYEGDKTPYFVGVVSQRDVRNIQLAKQLLYSGLNTDLRTQVRLESLALETCRGTFDHEEAARAFLEKRDPIFRGK